MLDLTTQLAGTHYFLRSEKLLEFAIANIR